MAKMGPEYFVALPDVALGAAFNRLVRVVADRRALGGAGREPALLAALRREILRRWRAAAGAGSSAQVVAS